MKSAQRGDLIMTLKDRFANNMRRHPGVDWTSAQARLAAHPAKLQALHEMEATGGAPDVVGADAETGELVFCDCCHEQVFVHHNGAESCHAARGFRGRLDV